MSEMTPRERFHAVMKFRPGVRTLLWEFSYWTATVERWYKEGLRRSSYSPMPGLPPGEVVFAEGCPYPHRPGKVRYRDVDVHRFHGFDDGAVRVPITWRIHPSFPQQILEDHGDTQTLINTDGVTVKVHKKDVSLPQFLDWPVRDRADWERLRTERLGPDLKGRFTDRWETQAETYRDRDYPLGITMEGFFSTPRELIGVERQLRLYYEDPALMHDINRHLADLWLTILEELYSRVDLDFVLFTEDMAFKTGPLISPQLFDEFIAPYYKRLTQFIRSQGTDIVFVDTDGDCRLLIPGFLDAGVDGLLPNEVMAGMDLVKIRKQFPTLLLQGGLDKTRIARSKIEIDAELEAK